MKTENHYHSWEIQHPELTENWKKLISTIKRKELEKIAFRRLVDTYTENVNQLEIPFK
mgnify:CR=1 FL=1